MHHIFCFSEILYNIFGHLYPKEDRRRVPERPADTRDLAALARTCRTFKEPALDVLWSELPDLSALARCVPAAIYLPQKNHYAFKRRLTAAEWATLRSYARRVWTFRDCAFMEVCLEEQSIAMLFRSSGTLFPNLRFVSWYHARPFPIAHVATPSLRTIHLDLQHANIRQYKNILHSAGTRCPLIKQFQLVLPHQNLKLDNVISNHVLCWSNLRLLDCVDVALNTDAILHVSRMPTLDSLAFALSNEVSNQIILSDFDLVFLGLSRLEILSGWPLSIVDLFARTRLPAIKDVIIRFPGFPHKQTVLSLMASLRIACSADTLTNLRILSQRYLFQRLHSFHMVDRESYALGYDALHSCTAFGNLRSLYINLEQPVSLADDDLVRLASSWPHLKELFINPELGWRTLGGITLNGLLRLLRTCPALHSFSLLLDTPTLTSIPWGTDVSYPAREMERVNLVDSPMRANMFAGVVNVWVAIGFLPRLLSAWAPLASAAVGLGEAFVDNRSSWQEVHVAVKARMGVLPSEDVDEFEPWMRC